ncbi:MAG TPA: hypothetical protein VLC09_01945 [Polyangiaceae bacterium]|nr:hypothetical protein [Polyangiaceae bacterium]
MKNAAYLLIGLVLVLVQGTLHRLLAPFLDQVWFGLHVGRVLHGATPSLVLPLVVYLGIHEASTARGALLAYGLGWIVDVLAGGPAFLFRFTMVAIWWLSRITSSRVSAQSAAMRIPLAFAASLVESIFVLTLLAIFGTDNRRPLELSAIVLPRAIGTALFAPFVFALAQRLQADTQSSSGQAQGAASS